MRALSSYSRLRSASPGPEAQLRRLPPPLCHPRATLLRLTPFVFEPPCSLCRVVGQGDFSRPPSPPRPRPARCKQGLGNLHAGAGIKHVQVHTKRIQKHFEYPCPLSPQILLCFDEAAKPKESRLWARLGRGG